MSRRQDGGNGNGSGDVARGAGYAAFLGAGLIAVAVVIGIVLLQIGDRNDNGPSAAANPTTPSTSTTQPHKTSTSRPNKHTTTTVSSATRPPGQVSIIVLNGGAATGKAGSMSDALKLKGYTNQGIPTDWSGHTQTGNSAYCRAGLDREGAALTVAMGGKPNLIVPFGSKGPPNSGNRDCVVVVGAPG
jgi:hypothetical protein